MKKSQLFYLLITSALASVMFLTGCGGDDKTPTPSNLDLTVEADIASMQTKASWNSSGSKTTWESGDALGVFVGDNANVKLTLGQGDKFAGQLTAEPSATADYYGYYPYGSGTSLSGKTLSVALPATQQYAQGGFASSPMVAVYTGGKDAAKMTFQHPFSVLKISAALNSGVPDAGITSIKVVGNKGETLAGTAAVDLSGVSNTMAATAPIGVTLSGGSTFVTLDCGSGVTVSATGRTDFYVAVPAGDYADGFTFTFTAGGESVQVAYESGVTVARGEIATVQVQLGVIKEPKYNIPDPVFRQYLADQQYILIDNGEIAALYNLPGIRMRIYGNEYPNIKTFKGIEYFTECLYLDYDSSASMLEELDVTALTKLKHLQVTGQKKLKDLDVSKCTALEELWLVGSGVASLDLSGLSNLTLLSLGGLPITSIDVSQLPQMKVINLIQCAGITSLNVTNNPNLTGLTIAGTGIGSIDLSQNPLITYLDVRDTNISELDVSRMTGLYSFFLARTKIKRVDVSGKSALTELLMGGAFELEYLDLSGCNELLNVAMTGANGTIYSLIPASGTALDFSLADFSYYPKFKTLIVDDMTANAAIKEFICKNSTLETISLQRSTGISKIVVQNNPQLGTLWVNGLDMDNMDVTVSNNKTEDIIVTTPRP